MAPEPADTGRLTEQQRDTLDQYTSLTHQDGQAAVSVLQRSAWDVQVWTVLSSARRADWATGSDADCDRLQCPGSSTAKRPM